MAIDQSKDISYFVAEIEYDVIIPAYEGSSYEQLEDENDVDIIEEN